MQEKESLRLDLKRVCESCFNCGKGGQTREHAMLAKTAGVKRLIVVVNKMDDPTVAWSKERYDECTSKITPFLKGCGYNPKTDLDMMPISGFTGANMKERLDPKVCDWYTGPSFLELIDSMEMERKKDGSLTTPVLIETSPQIS